MSARERVLIPNLPKVASHAPAGWIDLIEAAIAALDRAHPGWCLLQVKRELGGLRIHYSPTSGFVDPVRKAIDEIELRSLSMCDICGEPATSRGTFPHSRTRCEKHRGADDVDIPIEVRPVEALDDTMAGVWLVSTQGTTHIWDLDNMTYTRQPGPGSQSIGMLFDGNAMPITRVQAWPTVGESFFVWFDDPEDPALLEHYRISTNVRTIEPVEHLRHTPGR